MLAIIGFGILWYLIYALFFYRGGIPRAGNWYRY